MEMYCTASICLSYELRWITTFYRQFCAPGLDQRFERRKRVQPSIKRQTNVVEI